MFIRQSFQMEMASHDTKGSFQSQDVFAYLTANVTSFLHLVEYYLSRLTFSYFVIILQMCLYFNAINQ